MKTNKNFTSRQKLQRLTTAAVLTAISLVLVFTLRFPLFTDFYELEFSDFPLIMCSFVVGPVYGFTSLFIVCLIQSLTVSSFSGIIGFIMHFAASGAMMLTVWLIRTKVSGKKGAIIAAIAGVSVMTLVMIPMNIWLTSVFMKLPISEFIGGFLGVCILFNIIKATSNVILFYILYPPISKQYQKLFNRK